MTRPRPAPLSPFQRALRAWSVFAIVCAALAACRISIGVYQVCAGQEWARRVEQWGAEEHGDSFALFQRIVPSSGLPLDDVLRQSGLDVFPRRNEESGRIMIDVSTGFAGLRRPYRVRLFLVDGRMTTFATFPATPFQGRHELWLYRAAVYFGQALWIGCGATFLWASHSVIRDRTKAGVRGQYALAASLAGALGWLMMLGSGAVDPTHGIELGAFVFLWPAIGVGLLTWGMRARGLPQGLCTRCQYNLTGYV